MLQNMSFLFKRRFFRSDKSLVITPHVIIPQQKIFCYVTLTTVYGRQYYQYLLYEKDSVLKKKNNKTSGVVLNKNNCYTQLIRIFADVSGANFHNYSE